MKIEINLKDLINLLEKNEKVLTKSVNFPILSYILLDAKDNKLCIYSTDFELNLKTFTNNVKVEKQGKVCVLGRELISFLKGLEDQKILLSKEKDLVLKSKNFEIKIKTISPDDYPSFPEFKEKLSFKIKAKAIKNAIRYTYQAATIIETRPEISGFLIKNDGSNLKIVTTDSFRLAEYTIFDLENFKEDFEAIIPYKVGKELYNLFSDEDDITFKLGENQIMLESKNIVISSRLIEGKFPDYQRIIPRDFVLKVVLKTEDFLNSLKKVSIFSTKINDVKIKTLYPKKIQLISKDQERGESVYTIDAKVDGKDLELNFNYKYLIEGINQLESEKIILNFTSKEKPLLIRPLEDSSYLYLVMPIREM